MAMTLRLNEDDHERLREIAQRQGLSMQEVVHSALQQYFARHEEFRAKHVRRFLSEDAELLDLLSQ